MKVVEMHEHISFYESELVVLKEMIIAVRREVKEMREQRGSAVEIVLRQQNQMLMLLIERICRGQSGSLNCQDVQLKQD